MNYCLDILENTHLNSNTVFNLHDYEKYMLLSDSIIDSPPSENLPTVASPIQSDHPSSDVPMIETLQTPDHREGWSLTNARPTREGWSLTSPDCQGGQSLTKKNITEYKTFRPAQLNTLFWCFFVQHYGMKDYELIGTRYQNAELDEKYRISEALEKQPGLLKATNYSPSKQSIKEMCASIVSSTRDDFFSLIAFCAYYKTNTLVVFDNSRTYLRFSSGKSPTTGGVTSGDYEATPMVLRASKRGRGTWQFALDHREVGSYDRITNEYVELNTYIKPLKGIGSYKSDELIDMATKMGIQPDKKDGKKELYEKIGQLIGTI